MLQVSTLRQKTQWVKERLAIRNFKNPEWIDEIIFLDDERKKMQLHVDTILSQINSASKEIGKLMALNQHEAAEQLKQQVASNKIKITDYQNALQETEKELHEKLVLIPNLPNEKVPPGKTPEENEIVKEAGNKPAFSFAALPHWELAKKFNLIDFELGTKITGSGFPVYINKGAKLQRALIQYFLQYNTTANYIEYLPPFMVNESSAYGTGQLPDKEGQMYYVQQDNFYLIPTAEVPVTNIYRDLILKENELPVKMTAYTPCFRREAGSYGKDVRGLNRLHQFEKVEIIQIVKPEHSYHALEEMVQHVERLLQSLELPYRILRLCGGDIGFTSAMTYDFEVYSAAQQRWLEVSSVSNFESYQANRIKCRFKDGSGKTQLTHTLNGSALALPRIYAALLENNQTANEILLPKALHAYFGEEKIS